MKASEARQLVTKASQELEASDQVQYQAIMSDIEKEIKKNLAYEMWHYKTISPSLDRRLKADGYSVTNHSDQRDGTMYKISWKREL
ncbi:hypothetical protein [Chitinophaga pinensis]|uniref:Uncharacterized protein n=1 Tax=Chitinophaga pinensis (strain ATCC 43595 / DSM 2588 / LMG 13176 / NBRC 15968 / NCIMB 11800 / UQM 2034) TaxID=485918 RepID=A0A979G635_CHIPD|nr:hypothetical protein [Chitinophaga pinensis]ACU61292.1 hypothetical protein Cpin_3830 [Chitinophaga pinensis DSM 2588]